MNISKQYSRIHIDTYILYLDIYIYTQYIVIKNILRSSIFGATNRICIALARPKPSTSKSRIYTTFVRMHISKIPTCQTRQLYRNRSPLCACLPNNWPLQGRAGTENKHSNYIYIYILDKSSVKRPSRIIVLELANNSFHALRVLHTICRSRAAHLRAIAGVLLEPLNKENTSKSKPRNKILFISATAEIS